jgi:replicative DNA helicase
MASFAQLNTSEGLPSSIHTEIAILGAMLLDGVAISDATAKLKAEDFSLDSHQRVYRAMVELMARGHGIDLTTLRAELERRRELDSVGGAAYLFYLTEGIPRNFNIESYVQIVKDKSLLRQLMSIFHDGAIRASDQSEDAITVLGDVEAQLADVADSAIQRGLSGIGEIVASSFGSIDKLYEQGREVTGLATHYTEFDKMTSGLQDSELIIIAARPSMGKTAWAINIAQNAAVHGDKVVAVFSLEMSKESLLRRMLASEARVGSRKLQTGTMMREDRGKLIEALGRLVDAKMFIDDTPGITLAEMRAKARRLKQQEGRLDLIMVDYLQLMTGTNTSGKKGFENRTQEVSSISRGLKALA